MTRNRALKAIQDLVAQREREVIDAVLAWDGKVTTEALDKAWDAREALRDARAAAQDLVFYGCLFRGPPPAPFVTWLDWASQPTLQGVRIQALEALGPPIPLDLDRTSPKVTDHG